MATPVSKYGGYDYKFCDPLPDECPCPVCTLVQKDPHQLTCCGKIFCKSCLDELIKHNKSCPNCRGNFIRGKKYFSDMNTERKINHLRIHCGNEKQGCTWIGCLKDLKRSHVVTCLFEPVHCTNKRTNNHNGSKIRHQCGTLVKRSDLQKHMTKECQWRQVTCVHCNFKSSFNFIKAGPHSKKCSIPVTCDNKGCQEKVKQSLMEQHQATCPHKIVTCRYSSVGCKKKFKRGYIETHNKECMEEHLDNAVGTLERVLKSIEELKEKDKKEKGPLNLVFHSHGYDNDSSDTEDDYFDSENGYYDDDGEFHDYFDEDDSDDSDDDSDDYDDDYYNY